MLTTIKTYLAVGVIVLTLMLAGYSYKLHGDVQRLEREVAMYAAAAEANKKEAEDAKSSCLVTVDLLNQHYRDEIALSKAQQEAGDAINSLPTLTIKENANAAPTKPKGFSDDDRLSPDLMQLLDRAYCDGDKDSCSPPAK
ncbi:hypothetical protein QGX20_gp133 [Pseudomonas phage phiPsa300]|uniref:Uncharacterized protein n=2 Tax=Otagovirus TaxID=2560197 RepID=A0A7G9V1E1_9CAUD|nr:hypothetical protein QGX18_gp138 [Pseudomonas phage phiPsa347]YP_010767875.1 hypothetical protein QGX20_gp133 [Pseudomonas phage phiPsa300]QNO00097.1 hypothetical protein phiPsa300_089 [Pseudomonas phage phiPsa300]QNO00442.1 hypothetical protein phiPsa347_090 [Pseudomonas phage phiPsa347]